MLTSGLHLVAGSPERPQSWDLSWSLEDPMLHELSGLTPFRNPKPRVPYGSAPPEPPSYESAMRSYEGRLADILALDRDAEGDLVGPLMKPPLKKVAKLSGFPATTPLDEDPRVGAVQTSRATLQPTEEGRELRFSIGAHNSGPGVTVNNPPVTDMSYQISDTTGVISVSRAVSPSSYFDLGSRRIESHSGFTERYTLDTERGVLTEWEVGPYERTR